MLADHSECFWDPDPYEYLIRDVLNAILSSAVQTISVHEDCFKTTRIDNRYNTVILLDNVLKWNRLYQYNSLIIIEEDN